MRAGTRPAPCMGSVKGGEMDQRTPLSFFLAFLLSCFLAFLLSCFLAFLLSCFLAFLLASFLACFFVRRDVSSSRRHFLAYFASSTDLLVDSVLRRGQLVVEAIGIFDKQTRTEEL